MNFFIRSVNYLTFLDRFLNDAAERERMAVWEMSAQTRDGLGGSAMKAIVLLCMVVLVIPPPIVADAAPGAGCPHIVQNLKDAAAGINDDATSYWAHRARFVDLIFGPSSDTIAHPPPAAEQEKSQAAAVKQKCQAE
jgi:hypothetical protein